MSERAECRTCRSWVELSVGWNGHVHEWCPHCHGGQPLAARITAAAKEWERIADTVDVVTCVWCGGDYPYDETKPSRQYCSSGCQEAKRSALRRVDRYRYPGKRTCRLCQNDITDTYFCLRPYCKETRDSKRRAGLKRAYAARPHPPLAFQRG